MFWMERRALNQGVCLATIKLKAPHVLRCPWHTTKLIGTLQSLPPCFSRLEKHSQYYSVYYSLPVSTCPLRGLFLVKEWTGVPLNWMTILNVWWSLLWESVLKWLLRGPRKMNSPPLWDASRLLSKLSWFPFRNTLNQARIILSCLNLVYTKTADSVVGVLWLATKTRESKCYSPSSICAQKL